MRWNVLFTGFRWMSLYPKATEKVEVSSTIDL